MRTISLLLPVLLVAAAPASGPATAQETEDAADEVTIFRCTDAQGRLALQDTPCADSQHQQARTMPKPQDRPPDNPVPPGTAAIPAAPAPPEPVLVEAAILHAPRPMYECVTPDGERYTSDSGDGNPRPAPVWHYGGYPAWPAPGVPAAPQGNAERRAAGIASQGMSTSPGPSLTRPAQQPGHPAPPHRPWRPGHSGRHGHPVHLHGNGWIRDQCHPLPQAQICDLLRERRRETGRRIFNAQPSERAVLRAEERDIVARLNQDC